jgi:hypothetical protein
VTGFTFDISMHDILNPPLGNSGSNIKLKLINSKEITFDLNKNNNQESIFSLSLADYSKYGLNNTDNVATKRFIDDLVLSINLILKRGCITRNPTVQHSVRFNEEIPQSGGFVRKNKDATKVYLFESFNVRDNLSAVVTTNDVIDESESLPLFQKIRDFNRYKNKQGEKNANLISSLKHYENAMKELERLFKFQHIFNAFEIIVNINGTNFKGDKFDNEANEITGVPQNDIKNWRCFYNRIKHAHKNPSDLKTLSDGEIQFPSWMLSLREATKKVIKTQIS